MKFYVFVLWLVLLSIPCAAAEQSEDSGEARAHLDGDALYNQAEELEWYKENNMKEVDELYDKAIAAGSDKAYMARAATRLFMSDPKSPAHKRLAGELCPKMADIVKKWQPDPDADQMFHIARYYSMPWCKNRDLKKVQEMLKKSAENGNAKAQYSMGRMLRSRDPKAARSWYDKAAEAGFPQAVANQGVCYLLGLDVKKDHKKGMELINKALASKNPNTLYDIAIWYLQGDSGLPKDVNKAEKILKELVAMDFEQARQPLKDLQKGAPAK